MASECRCEAGYTCLACRVPAAAHTSAGGRDWADHTQCPARCCTKSTLCDGCRGTLRKLAILPARYIQYRCSGKSASSTGSHWYCYAESGHEGYCVAYTNGDNFAQVWAGPKGTTTARPVSGRSESEWAADNRKCPYGNSCDGYIMCSKCQRDLTSAGILPPYYLTQRCNSHARGYTCLAGRGHAGLCVAYYDGGARFKTVWITKDGYRPSAPGGCCENPDCDGTCATAM